MKHQRKNTTQKQPSTPKGKTTKPNWPMSAAEKSWRDRWERGYDYIDPDYVPGTHDAEKGDVTWHTVFVRPEKDRKEGTK